MTTTLTDAIAPRVSTRTRRVFVPLALLAILMAAIGFWPGYFGPVLAGTKAKTLLVHAHALVFVGWLAMFATQAALAATGRIALQHGDGLKDDKGMVNDRGVVRFRKVEIRSL